MIAPASGPSPLLSLEGGALSSAEPLPLLTRAARSIAASGRAHTIVDVLHGRALRHYAEGLRQYLAVRLGGLDEAERAFEKLRAVVAAQASDELVAPPGIRARLYGLARRIASQSDRGEGALPWRPGRDTRRAARLEALRECLGPAQAELLELRHARELRPNEIAFVVEQPVEEVLEALHGATRRAAELVHFQPGDRLRELLLEAFALEGAVPGTRDEDVPLGPEPLPPGAVVGERYRVQARVGTGAFGDVYRAEDEEVPGHVVAVKLLHQPSYSREARESALRELRHLASVFHPSVVSLKDHGWHEGRLWFVMPWYEGETLESRLMREPLSRAEARRIFEALARALAAVHGAGLRHQDVKPENVFLAEVPVGEEKILPVLIDLGVAATEAEMLVAGTPTYFAPEVAAQFASVENKPRVTSKADVFALALALRNALEPETQEDVPAGAVESFIERRARELPPLPESRSLRFLAPHFKRWMSLDPDERPTSEELVQELAVLTRPEDRRRRRWRLLRWLIPAVLVLGVVAGSIVMHFRARAARNRLEARAAQLEVAAVREDLEATTAERQRVEEDAERIRANLQRAQLGRAQLESELATTRATLRRERERLAEREAELEEKARALEEARASVQERDAELAGERARVGALEAEVARERAEVAESRARVDALEDAISAKEAEVAAERARRAAADARAASFEEQLQAAIRGRNEAERALRRERERAEAASAAASGPAPTPEEPLPSAP
ncbi:MAG TPA: protein kinase [Polyangiaceae bacterium LLY-WYZ-15_(1-7)]|nr:hypothetical protein [Sandaracinus sp.]MBJ70967.1 hypothetical protein [Sandaracinus sp.]HJL02790.1 protein kinase [Polyangiaceae bacterium LLY-WYZ-15_(1-7)]HJL12605.1 protein kinase [Polyangiaceae bacterium LLY-WYZ-15_(1-7)]HJL35749.1 protein kinase [Polyangiaceae bacterium LLY-WYZ-15_(1-7)]